MQQRKSSLAQNAAEEGAVLLKKVSLSCTVSFFLLRQHTNTLPLYSIPITIPFNGWPIYI